MDAQRNPIPSANPRSRLGVHDPLPFESTSEFWRAMSQGATIGMFIIVIGAVLHVAQPLLLPVLSAVVVGMTVGPLTSWALRRGVPAWVSALLTVLLVLGCGYAAVVSLSGPLTKLLGRTAEIGAAIKDKFYLLNQPLAALRDLQSSVPGNEHQTVVVAAAPTDLLGSALAIATPAAVQFLMFLVTLFFFLLGRERFRSYTVRLFASRDGRLRTLRILNDIEQNLSGYLLTVTIINIGVGLVVAAGTWAMGLPTPLLWGALAFALNYIPYIGPAILHVVLFAVGLLTFPTLTGALAPPLFSLAVNILEGEFITPNILGRRLSIAALIVFLNVAFWAWLWGPLGAFLAMPILIVGMVTLKHLYPTTQGALPD